METKMGNVLLCELIEGIESLSEGERQKLLAQLKAEFEEDGN